MENTSISNLILPTPFNQKTSHNFQLVHSKVNRFSISDLYHLSIWLSRAVFHHGHGLSPVVIYCEVVIVTVTKTAKRLLYLCALSSWPCECPSFEKCAWLLKKNNLTAWNVSLRSLSPNTVWSGSLCASRSLFKMSDFCVTPRWLQVQITLNRKVNSYSRKQWAWLSGTSIIVSTKTKQLSQSHASVWSVPTL